MGGISCLLQCSLVNIAERISVFNCPQLKTFWGKTLNTRPLRVDWTFGLYYIPLEDAPLVGETRPYGLCYAFPIK